MSLITQKAEDFLFRYLNNPSPTGFESEGQKIWLDYIKPFIDEWHVDNYGSVYGIINPGKDYRVVIEAHADEISWFVNHISDNGFIHVIRNGGSDHIIAPSKRVNIHTDDNKIIKGVFGWPAIHTRREKDNNKTPDMDNIFIDIGANSKDEVLSLGVNIGNVITFEDEVIELNGKYYCGRALDNRIGGFCIALVAELLKRNKIELPFSLYIVNAVQEEVGLRGAEMIANTIKPHVAIITDVCHDTGTPMLEPKTLGDIKCGKGPDLTVAPAVHHKLLNLIRDAANENNIPYQRSASSRVTGTDTDAFAYSNGGVPSALISLPLRYMHTTVEMAHKDDIEHLISLMYHSLLKIENNHNFKYF
ncbi:MAG TPA: M42 family metallopeptidase [Saprospiraceae bacterium]|nr:peptidase M42 [Saprospirales bacterium]HRQ30514.1 M42 family metallopeptidase [Saprospiraceae bacterium]